MTFFKNQNNKEIKNNHLFDDFFLHYKLYKLHNRIYIFFPRTDDYVLEIGFGQGEGLKMVWDRVRAGQGAVFGLEMSVCILKCILRHRGDKGE